MAVTSRFARGSLHRLAARLSRCTPVLTCHRRNSSTVVPVDDMISGLTDTQMQVRVQLLIEYRLSVPDYPFLVLIAPAIDLPTSIIVYCFIASSLRLGGVV